MRIWIVDEAKQYADILLANGAFQGCDWNYLSQVELELQLTALQSARQCEARESLCIVINIRCVDAIKTLLNLISQPNGVDTPRIVVLSSLTTWCGKKYVEPISNLTSAFENRVPLLGSYELYDLENALSAAATSNGVELFIVGIGLLYGGNGADLLEIFKSMWSNSLFPNVSDFAAVNECVGNSLGNNKVPMCHCLRLSKCVTDLLHKGTHEFQNVFVPCVEDCQGASIYELIRKCNNIVNGGDFVGRCEPQQAQVAASLNANTLWNCDINFNASTVSGNADFVAGNLLSTFTSVWNEFLTAQCLSPLSVVVAGPPKSGKTVVSKLVSEKMELRCVDVLSAVQYMFNLDCAIANNSEYDTIINMEVLAGAKTELNTLLEAKFNEGKKLSKDKNAPPPEVKVNLQVSDITDTFCASLPAPLVRKCIAAILLTDNQCKRKGYVLDVWGFDGVLSTADAVNSILSCLKAAAPTSTVEGNSDSTTVLDAVPSPISHLAELFIEIKCPSSLILERFTTNLGPGATKNKEAQVHIKALETRLTSYQSSMVPLNEAADATTIGATEETTYMTSTHSALLSVESGSMLYLDAGVTQSSPIGVSVDSLVESVIKSLYDRHNGRIGWLSPYFSDSSSSSQPTVNCEPCADQELPISTDSKFAAEPVVGDGLSNDTSGPVNFIGISEANNVALQTKSEKSQEFLSNTVLPMLASGMINILRNKPDDPILFLSNYLRRQSEMNESMTKEIARAKFYEMLHAGNTSQ